EVSIPGAATVGASYAITGEAEITPPAATVSIGTDTVTVTTGDAKPHPRITAPASGSTVTGTVAIKAVDDSGEDDIVRAVFEYSTTETSWNKICDDTDGTDGWGCSWDTTAVADDDYTIRVTMYDAADQNGKSAISVSVDNLADPDYELDLDAGLNLVSIPKTINGTNDAETVFSLDPYAGEFCVYYNAFTEGYDVNPKVKQCRGYWVFKNAAETVGVSFDTDAGAASQQLYEGWNMVGHVSLEAVPIYEEGNDADFGSLTGLEEPEGTKLYRQVCAYTQAGGWEYYPAGDLTDMTPGMGAWILVKQDVMMYGMP
ncbi:MAG: Ig-like domain-containing protein, partial [Candidatus Methanogasteraceae archaeon]